MKHTQNASDAQCSSQKTQTIEEGKNAVESDVQSCSQLKRGSEPAFPVPSLAVNNGMTIRQYAAIKLCVPDSGLPWLDKMIVQSNRERLAAAALQGMLADPQREGLCEDYAKHAYLCADAMLKAREAK
jgi:hypothetical protein